jgi:hypothetical protein
MLGNKQCCLHPVVIHKTQWLRVSRGQPPRHRRRCDVCPAAAAAHAHTPAAVSLPSLTSPISESP